MDRRNFIRLGLAGIGSSIIVPKMVVAECMTPAMAGGLYYTKDAPGRWSKKIDGHLPSIELQKSEGKLAVQVVTGHEMDAHEHYIVKHVLLDKDFKFMQEKMFDPTKDKSPISTFTLESYSGPLYALSVCNKHDSWLNLVEV